MLSKSDKKKTKTEKKVRGKSLKLELYLYQSMQCSSTLSSYIALKRDPRDIYIQKRQLSF